MLTGDGKKENPRRNGKKGLPKPFLPLKIFGMRFAACDLRLRLWLRKTATTNLPIPHTYSMYEVDIGNIGYKAL